MVDHDKLLRDFSGFKSCKDQEGYIGKRGIQNIPIGEIAPTLYSKSTYFNQLDPNTIWYVQELIWAHILISQAREVKLYAIELCS